MPGSRSGPEHKQRQHQDDHDFHRAKIKDRPIHSVRAAPKTPLTNRAEPSLPNSFASSTASFTSTRNGNSTWLDSYSAMRRMLRSIAESWSTAILRRKSAYDIIERLTVARHAIDHVDRVFTHFIPIRPFRQMPRQRLACIVPGGIRLIECLQREHARIMS